MDIQKIIRVFFPDDLIIKASKEKNNIKLKFWRQTLKYKVFN